MGSGSIMWTACATRRSTCATWPRRPAGAYTVVEKILEPGESLRRSWPVAGTSGYDFLIRVNNLFVEGRSEAAMTATYQAITGETASYDEVVQASKQQVMASELAAEVERLVGILADLSDGYRRHRDHTRRELRDTLREFIARFAVYRTYVRPGEPASDEDRRQVRARGRRRSCGPPRAGW